MEHLRVFESPCKKIRLGKNNDGGYIIADIDAEYDLLLAGGIQTDISFEEALLNKYPSLKGYAFDGTVNGLPKHKLAEDRLIFVKKNIGDKETESLTNLNSYFVNHSNIFMKMDIEGGENKLFEALTDADLLKIKQLVIEFHSANQIVIPTRLAKTHWLVHLHANNCCGTRKVNNIDVPNVFECTYIRKNKGENLQYNTNPIPDPLLDQRNVVKKPEIILNGEPYITNKS